MHSLTLHHCFFQTHLLLKLIQAGTKKISLGLDGNTLVEDSLSHTFLLEKEKQIGEQPMVVESVMLAYRAEHKHLAVR